MLINTSRKMLETVVQWFQLSSDIVYSRRQLARIPIKQSDKHYAAERINRVSRHKR